MQLTNNSGKARVVNILSNKWFILGVWVLLGLIAAIKHSSRGVFNDYLIFKSVYYHTVEQVNLYLYYPELNGDCNHYGPIFSILFAPFALMPDYIGTVFWDMLMTLVLFYTVYHLPIKWNAKVIIYYVLLQGVYTNAVNSETNGLVASFIIGSFILIRKEHDFWAACLIALGTMIKLYGIVGFAFFFFSKNKFRLSWSFVFWCVVFFVLPMLISSPHFVMQTYVDWYESLVYKNSLNIASLNQDISVMGMIRRISGNHEIGNLPVLLFAVVVFGLQYINISKFKETTYQLGILASTLLFVVLFSTGSEYCTYVIAACGIAIWFILQEKPYKPIAIGLLIFTLILIFAASGLVPSSIRHGVIRHYALLALPHFVIWLVLVYQLIVKKGECFDKNCVTE